MKCLSSKPSHPGIPNVERGVLIGICFLTVRRSLGSSNVQGFEKGNALLGQFPVLFDEVVFNAADFGGGEGFYPIDAASAHRHLRVALARGSSLCGRGRGLHVYVLKMHRVEAAWVPREVFRGDEAGGNR